MEERGFVICGTKIRYSYRLSLRCAFVKVWLL